MKRRSHHAAADQQIERSAFKQLERVVLSVLLVIGVAALIGWIAVELYVKAVTLD